MLSLVVNVNPYFKTTWTYAENVICFTFPNMTEPDFLIA